MDQLDRSQPDEVEGRGGGPSEGVVLRSGGPDPEGHDPDPSAEQDRGSDDAHGRVDGERQFLILGLGPDGTVALVDPSNPGSPSVTFARLDEPLWDSAGPKIAMGVGALNLAAQVAQGAQQTSGLVRLAPQTMALIRTGNLPMSASGWNLGTLVEPGGAIVAQVRWAPLGALGAAANITAAAGLALALLAIQWQLGQVERLVGENIELTNEVLRLIRTEQWAEIHAYYESVRADWNSFSEVGAITREIWEHAQAQGSAVGLRKHRALALENCRHHNDALAARTSVKERRRWLAVHADAVIRDSEGLRVAEAAWLQYQALRVAYLVQTGQPENVELATKLTRQTIIDHQQAQELLRSIVDDLYRQFRLIAECPGKHGSFELLGRKRTREELQALAVVIAERLGGLSGVEDPERGPVVQTPTLLDDTDPSGRTEDEVLDRLRWILRPGETLLAVSRRSKDYTVVTSERILLLKESAFLKTGMSESERDLDQVKDIEAFAASADRGPAVRIVFMDGDTHTVKCSSRATTARVNQLTEAVRSLAGVSAQAGGA